MPTSNQSPLVESPACKQRYRQYFAAGKRSNDENLGSPKIKRLSAGLRLRGRFHLHRAKSAVPHHSLDRPQYRKRSTSADSWRDRQARGKSHPNTPNAEKIAPQVWSMTAESGVGLKAQRLSLELPDDLDLQVVDLYTLYAEQNKLLGRHTKSVGKGATANVRLVHKKGDHSGEVYAAKEFRGKTLSEASEEYEKKVKSEYCIAKSVHHPNIVETFSLCTHHGRWSQVMEFCDQGDLFSLVSQKYLSSDEHLVDRLCLFKQLVQGLNYLHENGIAHRDVKLENLLLTKQSKLKITDFGVSEVFSGQHPGLGSIDRRVGQDKGEVRLCAPGICGSPPYIAPEVIAKQGEPA
jgi:protein-serine/threonine kinase